VEDLTQLIAGIDADALCRATVVTSDSEGVLVTTPNGELVTCDVLESAAVRPGIGEGDEVLVWLSRAAAERGVVLGRIRTAVRPTTGTETADELVLEAKTRLTLKVGDGSITIRDDGKILIKGKDLVSHAERANRIKGGSVNIN